LARFPIEKILELSVLGLVPTLTSNIRCAKQHRDTGLSCGAVRPADCVYCIAPVVPVEGAISKAREEEKPPSPC
jgi:hypothetical protein